MTSKPGDAPKPDDLEAVRTIVTTLLPFEPNEQERILRWSREKLNLKGTDINTPAPKSAAAGAAAAEVVRPGSGLDIKSFVEQKAPSTNNEFAATVAYYYRFEAPEATRKDSITPADLQEACRLTKRTRLTSPGQTLINSHTAGIVDKATERGSYTISTVGENLVAMTLPSGQKK